ncbi:Glutamate 5-kinase [Acidipropionibacterium acidipropionici ATCC 4875]|jgi:glutamate 5-kinase|uniref:Glutamate 5-kinase n=2 Tax=Acidipropionibacterium acidipropionici TaxID=1748 RepID=K7RS05_ACIA4|nr:Glutamate 5-kinase [Acidipropionibacterium acidipropionici ATCC 4875]
MTMSTDRLGEREAVRRADIAGADRIVVKVGSSSLTQPGGGIDVTKVDALVEALAAARTGGRQVVLVSSGAIAAGFPALGMTRPPRDLAGRQAAASVGQGILLHRYEEDFARHHVTTGQVLLTVEDLVRPKSYRNAWSTLGKLLALGVVPVVNENDTVATGEIHFGDNDRLAALVAELIRAQALVLLSDVDSLYTAHPSDPGARRISWVDDVEALSVDTSRSGSGVGTGGMVTKLEAARIATASGIPVVLAEAGDAIAAIGGDDVGTYFAPGTRRRPRKLLWLAHAASPQGEIHIDAGAVSALRDRKASLLAVGVTEVHGDFQAGDPVLVIGPDGRTEGRGIVSYSHDEVREMRGRSSAWLAREMGEGASREVIHRDALVLVRRRRTGHVR